MNLIYLIHKKEGSLRMSKKRRTFSAEFKTKLVLEALKGEKDINTIATENSIQPNLLRSWNILRTEMPVKHSRNAK